MLIGSHIDSVPGGGWLDGALGLLAGAEVLRGLADRGRPPVTVRLVDWADEEGARFGYGCLGSSAAARTVDAGGRRAPARPRRRNAPGGRWPRTASTCARMLDASAELEGAAAYVELHIEQGPVLERLGLPLGVVLGTSGVERHTRALHRAGGARGLDADGPRRDALAAAARLVLAVREPAREAGGVATVGTCAAEPGIVTAVPGACEITLDQRHLDARALRGDARRRAHGSRADRAGRGRRGAGGGALWGIGPVAFHPELIELADAVRPRGGRHRAIGSPAARCTTRPRWPAPESRP